MKASTARTMLNINEFSYADVINLITKACEQNKDCIFMRKDTYLNDVLVSRLRLDGYVVFYIKNQYFNMIGISWAEQEIVKKKSFCERVFG